MPSSADADDVKSERTSASSGTKRKREAGPKFYAVRVGQAPGIYHSWSDCLAQVKGFKGAAFKSFSTLTEAEAFVENKPSKSPTSTSTPTKYYAVQSGRTPGVYTDWPSAQAQITGWTKPKHKSFATRSEAEAFVKAGKSDGRAISSVTITMAQPESEDVKSNSQKSSKGESTPPTKKLKKNGDTSVPTAQAFEDGENITYAPGEAPLPADAEDGFDSHVFLNPETGKLENKSEKMLNATKMMPKKDSPTGMLNIYTDGSSLGNGQLGSSAGVGVFFGPGDTRNVSAPLVGPRQTNQRAELTAIQKALDLAPLDRSVTIFSDSNYAINCATTWSKTWRKNGWVTSAKKPVENKDIVELIVERIDTRDACGVTTEFKWLKGHANDPGNVAADALAVNGAREARNRARSEASTSALPAADYDEEYEA